MYWGIDAAGMLDDNLYECVIDHFGEPKIIGRYLGEIEDVAVAMTKDEIKYIHDQDIQILVIYNLITDATGEDHGAEHAKEAIKLAEALDVPEGVAIFGDIEPDFAVDSSFMEGWYKTIKDSPYEPGLYGVFDKSNQVMTAYNYTDEEVQKNTIVWTAYPQREVSSQDNVSNR